MHYSRTGDVERTFLILGRMEAMLDRKRVKAGADDGGLAHHPTIPRSAEQRSTEQQLSKMSLTLLDLPSADLVMYIAIIRGFIKSRRIRAANETKERMLKRFNPVFEKRTSLSTVLKDLETLNEAAAQARTITA